MGGKDSNVGPGRSKAHFSAHQIAQLQTTLADNKGNPE